MQNLASARACHVTASGYEGCVCRIYAWLLFQDILAALLAGPGLAFETDAATGATVELGSYVRVTCPFCGLYVESLKCRTKQI